MKMEIRLSNIYKSVITVHTSYEQEARQNKHVVDMYNYNPNNLWQNIYLHNQQIEQLMSISNLFTPYNFNETNQKPW